MNFILLISIIFSIISCGKKGTNYLYFDNPAPPRFSKRSYPIKNIFNNAQVDILWVIDNSGSMSSIQQNVVNNSQIFMDNFVNDGNNLDWKMGLMSTDKSQQPFIGFSTPLDRKSPDPVSAFQSAVNRLGTDGSASEYVFYNINRGIVEMPFLRKESHLAVIMVTDEEEQSFKQFGQAYDDLIFLERIKAVVGAEHNLRFYGALNLKDLTNCTGWELYANSPFETVITETKGFVISACVPDFGKQLAGIGKDILTLVKSPKVMLSDRPIIETLKVIYNGVEMRGGLEQDGYWYYDRYYNTINFYNLDFSPDVNNDDIRIEFQIDDGIDRDVE